MHFSQNGKKVQKRALTAACVCPFMTSSAETESSCTVMGNTWQGQRVRSWALSLNEHETAGMQLGAGGGGKKWVLCWDRLGETFWSRRATDTTFCCGHEGAGVHGLLYKECLLRGSRATYSSSPGLR